MFLICVVELGTSRGSGVLGEELELICELAEYKTLER